MNSLAGWGFATPEALERHTVGTLPKIAQPETTRDERVSTENLVAYAQGLGRMPSVREIVTHYGCRYEAARKRRYRLAKVWKAA